MRKSDKQNWLVVSAIVLCVMLTLGLCYLLNGEGFISALNYGENEEKYYLVCAGAYENIALARAEASLVKSRGGAGYVLLTDDAYNVVLAAYPSEEEAQAVLSNAASGGAYVKEVCIGEVKSDWAEKDVRGSVEKALGYFGKTYSALREMADGLSDETLTSVDVKNRLDVLRAEIDALRSALNAATAGKDDARYTEVKLALVTAVALIDNAEIDASSSSSSTARVNAASSLRYQTVQLILCRQSLASALSQ